MLPRQTLKELAVMWRFCFCVVVLIALPASAQTPRYDDDHTLPRTRSTAGRIHHHAARHPRGMISRNLEPYRLGPAPAGLWYLCDSPAGYYPYIPVCGTPWRIVPSTPPRLEDSF